ncbi:hypothetical protein GCM10027347_61650 [Larkinella harenae]
MTININFLNEFTVGNWRTIVLSLVADDEQPPYFGFLGLCNETIDVDKLWYFSIERYLLSYQFYQWYRGPNYDQPERPVHCIDILYFRIVIPAKTS